MATSSHHRLLVGCVFAALLLSQGCSEDAAPAKESAPDFSVALFDGNSFQLGTYRGKSVLINFFASWCVPCREEIPTLNQVYREYRQREVAFIGIAVNDTEDKAKQFVVEFDVSFPTGVDKTGEISDAFGLYGVPTTLFIDKEGIISYLHSGGVTEKLLKHELDKIL